MLSTLILVSAAYDLLQSTCKITTSLVESTQTGQAFCVATVADINALSPVLYYADKHVDVNSPVNYDDFAFELHNVPGRITLLQLQQSQTSCWYPLKDIVYSQQKVNIRADWGSSETRYVCTGDCTIPAWQRCRSYDVPARPPAPPTPPAPLAPPGWSSDLLQSTCLEIGTGMDNKCYATDLNYRYYQQLFCTRFQINQTDPVLAQSSGSATYSLFEGMSASELPGVDPHLIQLQLDPPHWITLRKLQSLQTSCWHPLSAIGWYTAAGLLAQACSNKMPLVASYVCIGDCASESLPVCAPPPPAAPPPAAPSSDDSSTVWIVVLASVLGVTALGLAGYCVYQRCEVRLE